ncbi:MAG: hypothetical protein IK105_00935 [Thermoguttaceae bacterium]|nr:hypothetical protein [Thermoguttaceae bacterium]MCR5359310.1 hypothetical protein [Thermoguttaceae bacterium]
MNGKMVSGLKVVLAAAFLCAVIGCGVQRRPKGMPKLYPCKVRITDGSVPVEGASVTFCPEPGGGAYTPGGTTDSNGETVLQINGRYLGAPLGSYKVTVKKTAVVYQKGFEPENIKIEPTGDEVEDRKTRFTIAQDYSEVVDEIDPVYSDPEETPLRAEVAKGKNSFDLTVSLNE